MSASPAFTVADVGRRVSIAGAGAAGAELHGQIIAVNSATSATLIANASTTVSGATARIADDITRDGTHPGPRGHVLLSAGIDTARL